MEHAQHVAGALEITFVIHAVLHTREIENRKCRMIPKDSDPPAYFPNSFTPSHPPPSLVYSPAPALIHS